MRASEAVAATVAVTSACSPLVPDDPFPRADLRAGLDRLVDTQAASAASCASGRGTTSGRPGRARRSARPPSRSAPPAVPDRQRHEDARPDDPVERHLPGVVPAGEAITVRQVLDHTSGIPDYAHERDLSTNRCRGDARFDSYHRQELLAAAFAERIIRPLRLRGTDPGLPQPHAHGYNPLRPADGTAATVLGLVAAASCPAAR